MANEKEQAVLEDLMGEIEGIENEVDVEGYLGGTQVGGETNIMGGEIGDQNENQEQQGENGGTSVNVDGIQVTEKGNTQFTADQMKSLAESANEDAFTQDQLAVIEAVRAQTEVVGYVYDEDETQAIEAVSGYKKDSKGAMIMTEKAKSKFPNGNPSDKEIRAAGMKKAEVFERETTLVLKSKAPSGLLGMLVKAPTDALTSIVTGEFQNVNAGAPKAIYPFSKNAFTTVVTDALNGEILESAKIVDKYLPKRGQNPVLVNPDEEQARKLESVTKFVPYTVEELEKVTDGTKGRESNRVRHAVRSGFAQPGNYIALKKSVVQTGLDGKLTAEQAEQFNKVYLQKFLVERKGHVVANTLKPGILEIQDAKVVDSQWFSANAAKRTAVLKVEHWGKLDSAGKRVVEAIALPQMYERTTATGKVQLRRVTKELVPEIPADQKAEDFILFESDKSFDKVRQAAGSDLLTFDVITALRSQNQEEKKKDGANRAGSKKELVGAEATNVRKANKGDFKTEGRTSKEDLLKVLGK